MITVDITRSETGSIMKMAVRGHADTAPRGQDIVCAGISSLTQAAILGLEQHLGRKLRLTVLSGQLDAELLEPADALSDAVLETMILGIAEIVKIYPRSVRIREHRR